MFSVVHWTLRLCFNDCIVKSAKTLSLLIKSLISYWTGNNSKKTKIAQKGGSQYIEDVIPLNQYMLAYLDVVVYRPPLELP